MLCKQCGAMIPDGAPFCTICGATPNAAPAKPAVDTSNQETVAFTPVTPVTPPPAAPVTPTVEQTQYFEAQQPAAPQPTYQPAYQESSYQQPQSYEAPKSSGNKNRGVIIAVIVVVLLALIGVAVAAVLILGNFGDDSGSDRGSRRNNSSIVSDDQAAETEGERSYELDESNLYYDQYVDAESYVLSAVETRYYSRSELSGMTRQQLYLAEREMFARYGCTFNDGDLDAYFSAKTWYTPDAPVGNFNESRMTDIERVNLTTLRAMLMEKDGTSSNNPYLRINNDIEGWILNSTDANRITKADVQDLDEKALTIAANEIYARRGYIFDDPELQMYFASKNWYVPEIPAAQFDPSTLSEIESENYTCLLACAEKRKGVKFSSGNKYQDYYYYNDYIIYGSDTRAIDPYELSYLSEEALQLARNEIYARYGYSFTNKDMREYFMNQSWYYPTVVSSKLELIHLTKTELANVKMIQAFELNLKLAKGEGNPNTKMSYYAKHDYLTMYLPAHWQDNCICIKPDGLSGDLVFYEKYNYEDTYGWLFTMALVPVEEGIPNYSGSRCELFGTVTTPEGAQYYVLRVSPSSDDWYYLEHVYDLMQSQIDTIWESIVWKSGYTFTPA